MQNTEDDVLDNTEVDVLDMEEISKLITSALEDVKSQYSVSDEGNLKNIALIRSLLQIIIHIWPETEKITKTNEARFKQVSKELKHLQRDVNKIYRSIENLLENMNPNVKCSASSDCSSNLLEGNPKGTRWCEMKQKQMSEKGKTFGRANSVHRLKHKLSETFSRFSKSFDISSTKESDKGNESRQAFHKATECVDFAGNEWSTTDKGFLGVGHWKEKTFGDENKISNEITSSPTGIGVFKTTEELHHAQRDTTSVTDDPQTSPVSSSDILSDTQEILPTGKELQTKEFVVHPQPSSQSTFPPDVQGSPRNEVSSPNAPSVTHEKPQLSLSSESSANEEKNPPNEKAAPQSVQESKVHEEPSLQDSPNAGKPSSALDESTKKKTSNDEEPWSP